MARGKKQKIDNPEFVDEKIIGTEPVWDHARALKMSDRDFDVHLRQSLFYYNHFFNAKAMRKHITKWLVDNKKLNKKDLAAYMRAPDNAFPVTVGSLIRAHNRGMPLKPRALDYIMTRVRNAVEANLDAVAAETRQPGRKLTIQDHLTLQLNSHLAHFDGIVDEQISGKDTPADAYNYLTGKNVPQAMVGKIASIYEAQRDEFQAAQKGRDEQLAEGYSQYKPRDFKRILAFYEALLSDLDRYAHAKKVTRKARVKKLPSREKLASKVKYKKDDAKLKIVSVNPTEIIGCQTLWVYNVKTRKLGAYYADSDAGQLGLRGTTILGYDPATSVQKTLRKPEEKLAEFLKAGKVQLRKFISDIRAVETPLSGRLNKDTVLLKVQ